jgi:hypothetical protein
MRWLEGRRRAIPAWLLAAAFPGRFKEAGRFRNGLAYVHFEDGGEGYIDSQGRVVYRQDQTCKPW